MVEQSVQLQQKQKLLDQAEKKLKSFEKNSEKDSEQVLKLRDENIELEKQLAALKAENKEKEKSVRESIEDVGRAVEEARGRL